MAARESRFCQKAIRGPRAAYTHSCGRCPVSHLGATGPAVSLYELANTVLQSLSMCAPTAVNTADLFIGQLTWRCSFDSIEFFIAAMVMLRRDEHVSGRWPILRTSSHCHCCSASELPSRFIMSRHGGPRFIMSRHGGRVRPTYSNLEPDPRHYFQRHDDGHCVR